MKTFNKKLISSAIVLTMSTVAAVSFAKGPGNSDYDPAQRFDYIFTQLSLTDAQQADVLAVLEQNRETNRDAMKAQMQALRDSEDRPSREEMFALREANREARNIELTDQLNMVLSPEVTNQFVEYLDAHRGMDMHADRGSKKGDKDGMRQKGDGSKSQNGSGQGNNKGQGGNGNGASL